MTPGAEDAAVRSVVLGLLVDNYRADGPNIDFATLAERAEAPLPQVAAVCAELIDANHAYGSGDPARAIRLNDNGFAFVNDKLALGLLEHTKTDEDA